MRVSVYAMLQCPLGVVPLQVESAFEFAEMCRDIDYHNFLFSMKASNPLVMVQVTSAAHWKRNAWCDAADSVISIALDMLLVACAATLPSKAAFASSASACTQQWQHSSDAVCQCLDGYGMMHTSQRTSSVLQAYRLLAEEMYTKGWDYPLHLGVTEVRPRAAAWISDAKASSDVHPARWTRTPGSTRRVAKCTLGCATGRET
jgi:hypothetical protein